MKIISILEWRKSKGLKPFEFRTQQERRDWEREQKQKEDARIYAKILKRGTNESGN